MLKKISIACLSILLLVTPVPLITEIASSQVIRDLQQEKVDRLIEKLRSIDISDEERDRAFLELGKMGASARSAYSSLLLLVSLNPDRTQTKLFTTILQIAKSSKFEIERLFPLLDSSNPDVRANAAIAIGKITQSLKSSNIRVKSLLKFKRNKPKAYSNLIAVEQLVDKIIVSVNSKLIFLLKDASPFVRANAVFAMYNIVESPKTFLPISTELLKDTDPRVRANVVATIGTIGKYAEVAIEPVKLLLQDPDDSVRANSVFAISILGKPKYILPIVLALLKDSSSIVRTHAIFATSAIMAKEQSVKATAIPQLIPLLKDPDRYVRAVSMGILSLNEESVKSKFPQLSTLIKQAIAAEKEPIVADIIVIDFSNPAQSELSDLLPLLKNSDPRIRWVALDALGELDNGAKSAIPQMMPLLQDPDIDVANKAAAMLKKLQKSQ
jgi:HEAT repeat protein